MKRYMKIIIVVAVVLIVLGIVWIIDNTRTIEKADDSIKQIAKDKDGENITGFPYAYSVEQSSDKLKVVLYGAQEMVKTIHTYYINNSVVTGTAYERHYNTKWQAKTAGLDLKDEKVEGNVVKGILSEEAVGNTLDKLLEDIETTYAHLKKIK